MITPSPNTPHHATSPTAPVLLLSLLHLQRHCVNNRMRHDIFGRKKKIEQLYTLQFTHQSTWNFLLILSCISIIKFRQDILWIRSKCKQKHKHAVFCKTIQACHGKACVDCGNSGGTLSNVTADTHITWTVDTCCHQRETLAELSFNPALTNPDER